MEAIFQPLSPNSHLGGLNQLLDLSLCRILPSVAPPPDSPGAKQDIVSSKEPEPGIVQGSIANEHKS